MHGYTLAAVYDRYKFMPNHIPFYNVSDEDCIKRHGVKPDQPTLIHYASPEQKKPYLMNDEAGTMNFSDINKFV